VRLGGSSLTPMGANQMIAQLFENLQAVLIMFRLLATISAIATLSACSSPQPFDWATENGTDETLETIDPTDPNVTVDSKFAYDRARGLTMNSVEYDSENDELIINNLPFDGPSGRYDRFGNVGAAGAYESRQTQYTGRVKHYAVFLRSEHIEAAAAAGADWVEFGYGGANITRDSFSAPIDGEYVYFGDYAGVRTFSDRSGLELVSGDVSILLDVNDFDPVDGIQGAIVGTIYNCSISGLVGSANASLQNVGLVLVEFTTDDGTFNGGGSVTSLANGTDGGSGSFDGFLAGPNSTDIGANIVMEGPAYSQNVAFDVVTYQVTEEVLNPVTGDVVSTFVTYGTASGLTNDERGAIQDLVDSGQTIPFQSYNPLDIPSNAVITGTAIDYQLFVSGFDAREIGVLVAEQQ